MSDDDAIDPGMSDPSSLDPRDAVLELLLEPTADPARRAELRTMVERDPAAAAELAEFERIDDLLRTAGPTVEPSEALTARVLMVPDEVAQEAPDPMLASASPEEDSPPLAATLIGADAIGPFDEPAPLPLEETGDEPAHLDDIPFEAAQPPPRLDLGTSDPAPWDGTAEARRERRSRSNGHKSGFFGSLAVWRIAAVGLAGATAVFAFLAFSGNDDNGGGGGTTSAVAPVTVTVQGGTETVPGPSAVLIPRQGEKAKGTVASASPTGGERTIHLTVTGLTQSGNQYYTVWLAKNPSHRVAIGSYRPDADGTLDVVVTAPDLGDDWQGVWLTRERATGEPGWSKNWVVRGKLS